MSEIMFKNTLNKLRLGKMDAKEYNILFACFLEVIKKKTNKVELSFAELKKMIGMAYRGEKRLIDTIDKMVDKFHQARHRVVDEKGVITYFNMLDETKIDPNLKKVVFEIKEKFMEYLIFDFRDGEYTKLDFETLVSLKSKYSKIAYKFIKQWETKGIHKFTMDEFKEEFEVTAKYPMCEIDKKILNVIGKELKDIIKGFKIEKVKSGRKVDKIVFTWQRVERKKKSSKEIIQPQQPASGSKKKFDKDLALEQTARAEAEVQELKLKENNIIEIIESLKEKKEIVNDKPFITESEFENMYQEWIKIEGVEDNKYTKKGYRLQIQGQYRILENKKAL